MEPDMLLQVLPREEQRGVTERTLVVAIQVEVSVQTELSVHLHQQQYFLICL